MQSKRGLHLTSSLLSRGTQNDANNDSPLRAFLQSQQNGNEGKDEFFEIPPDLFDIPQPMPSVASQSRNDNLAQLSLTTNERGAAGFFPPKNPDKYVEIGNREHKPLASASKQKDEGLRGTEEPTEKMVSYDTLNDLMEQTASTRCLLLQQTNGNTTSSQPLMRSLSESAFKTILSSTKIKIRSTTSVKSLINATEVQDFRSISECKNSTFGPIAGYKGPKEPKKKRMQSILDTSLMMPLRTSEETNHSCKAIGNANSPIKSLPSCGSLEDSYSEDEKHFGETIQNSSSSLPVYVDVASCHRLSRVGKSHSFQTKRKFNSFQTSAGEDYRQSRRSCNALINGDFHHTLQREEGNTSDKASGKISQTMRHTLQRELQRTLSSVPKFSSNY